MAGTVVFQVGSLATPGPGIVIGQDNVNGTAWQYVKLDVGAAGASSPVTPANPLPVIGTVQALGTVRVIPSSLVGENFFGTLFTAGQANGTLIAAPAQGTFIRILDMMVSGSAAGTAAIVIGSGTIFAPGVFAANGGFVFNSSRGVRTHGTSQDILFNSVSGTWGVSVNYSLET